MEGRSPGSGVFPAFQGIPREFKPPQGTPYPGISGGEPPTQRIRANDGHGQLAVATGFMECLIVLKQSVKDATHGVGEGVVKTAFLYYWCVGGVVYKLGATLWRLPGLLTIIKMHILSDSAIPLLEI